MASLIRSQPGLVEIGAAGEDLALGQHIRFAAKSADTLHPPDESGPVTGSSLGSARPAWAHRPESAPAPRQPPSPPGASSTPGRAVASMTNSPPISRRSSEADTSVAIWSS